MCHLHTNNTRWTTLTHTHKNKQTKPQNQSKQKVKHVDDAFLAGVTELYRQRVPSGPQSRVLDLCSSWVSHLPPELTYGEVVGHGMNAAELSRNPRLDRWFVR